MDDKWKGSEYTICPNCKQVVRIEDMDNGTHTCDTDTVFIPHISGVWD